MILSVESMFEGFGERNTELMLAAAESDFGQALNGQIRWEQFCFIAENVKHRFLPDERKQEVSHVWGEQWLDADVNNLQHNPFTALMGLAICRMEDVDEATTDRVVMALLVHDLKEYIFDPHNDEGDVIYDEAVSRGHEAAKQEHLELGEILRSDDFPMLSDDDVEQIIADLNDSKLPEPQTQAGSIIEIAEKFGYVHTGINANYARYPQYRGEDTETPNVEQLDMFKWQTDNALANHIPRLVQLSSRYKSVEWFLDQRSDDIAEAILDLNGEYDQKVVGQLYTMNGQDAQERRNKWDRAVESFIDYELRYQEITA